jgi:hypothetical protein
MLFRNWKPNWITSLIYIKGGQRPSLDRLLHSKLLDAASLEVVLHQLATNPQLETAALMLGASKSRGYCLEMICADFLAGAHLEGGNSESLLFALGRLYSLLPNPQKTEFVKQMERV